VLVAAGPANRGDWVTLAPVGSPASFWSGVYQFLDGMASAPPTGASSATLTFAAPATVGSYEFRFFADSGWTRLATSSTIVLATPNPVPVVSVALPTAVSAGASAFTLTVNGGNFVSSSVVSVNGSARSTTFVSSTQLTASILAGDVASIGTMTVRVASPAPGGGTSNAAGVSVTAPPPAPSLASVNPSVVGTGPTPLTIAVTGANFVPTSMVTVDGQPRATTFMSATTLLVVVLASDRVIGSHAIGVTTPAPGGGVSADVTLLVTAPALLVNGSAAPITLAAGAVLTVSVVGGPANPGDWVTLVPTGSPATFWSAIYQFMNGQAAPPLAGASSATLTFAAPPTPGPYELRFFANAGWTRLATSAVVTVQ